MRDAGRRRVPAGLADQADRHGGGAAACRTGQDLARRSGHALSAGVSARRFPTARHPRSRCASCSPTRPGSPTAFMQPPDGPYHGAGVSDGMDRTRTVDGGRGRAELRARVSPHARRRSASSLSGPIGRDAYGGVLGAACGSGRRKRLAAVTAERVTAPLNLASMGFDLADAQRDRLAAAYADHKPAPVRIPDSGQRVHFPEGIPL